MTKSKAAFQMSAERLFDRCGRLWFWTFTFNKVWPDRAYYQKWSSFHDVVMLHYPLSIGLKVIEVHPSNIWAEIKHGGSHGCHYHVLVNQRWDVTKIRQWGLPHDFGRNFVRLATHDDIAYLAKYLSKSRQELAKGIRAWSAFGGWNHVKMKDVECLTNFTRNLRFLGRGKQVPFSLAQIVKPYSELYGLWENWPKREQIACLDLFCHKRSWHGKKWKAQVEDYHTKLIEEWEEMRNEIEKRGGCADRRLDTTGVDDPF